MTRRSLLIIMTAIILSGSVSGHDPFTKRELANGLVKRATLKLADRYYAESVFYSAADNYKLYLKAKPNDRYATYWLAMSLYYARDYARCEEAFQAFYALRPPQKVKPKKWDRQEKEYFKEGRLFYGMVLHRNGKYDEAVAQLHKFKSQYYSNHPDQQKTLLKLANLELAGCDTARTLQKLQIKTTPLPPPINNAYTQAAPILYDTNTLYYTSVDENRLVKYTDTKSHEYACIYKSSKGSEGWNKGNKLSTVVTDDKYMNQKYFDGNETFNEDRTRFYFTKCLEMDDDRSLCNIFVADVKDGKIIGPATRLPEGINFELKYTSTQPTVRKINEKKEIVYYATNREGGKGGMDIWYTTRDDQGRFSAPKPFTMINTAGDELTPYFDDSAKTLFFSSDGLPGMGGFDVFGTTLGDDGTTWSDPYNVGKVLNTGADELYYTVGPDETYGYLVSNREGSIPLDGIATASDDIFYWEELHFAVDGKITRKGVPNANMDGARFNLYQKMPDGTTRLVAVDSTSTGGTYFFKLHPGKDYIVEGVKDGFLPQYDSITTKGLDHEDTLVANMKVAKDGFIVYGEIIGFDSLLYFGLENTTMVIAELKNGEEVPYKEMEVTDSFYYIRLPTERDYRVLVRKEGFFAGDRHISTRHIPEAADSVRADIILTKVERNKIYKLTNILYEFDRATLTKASKLVLDTLYHLLKDNPTFDIELASHTDGKGTDAYNMRLSQARAQSCVDYLIKKGIPRRRVEAKGYGMRKPIAPNTNPDGTDNPDGRALNRRTEFKVVKG